MTRDEIKGYIVVALATSALVLGIINTRNSLVFANGYDSMLQSPKYQNCIRDRYDVSLCLNYALNAGEKPTW